jgi:hypothetical protein
MKPLFYIFFILSVHSFAQSRQADTILWNGEVLFTLSDTLKQDVVFKTESRNTLNLDDCTIIDTIYKPYGIIYKTKTPYVFQIEQDSVMLALKKGNAWEVWPLFTGVWYEFNSEMRSGYCSSKWSIERVQLDSSGSKELILKCNYNRSINHCPDYEAYSEQYEKISIWNLDKKELYLSLLTIYTYDWWCGNYDEGQEMEIYKLYPKNGQININRCKLKFKCGGTNNGDEPKMTLEEKYEYKLENGAFILKPAF